MVFSYNCLYILYKNKIEMKFYFGSKKKRIGVVGLANENNIGNNLVKFSMYKILKQFGFNPTMISISNKKDNLYFIKKFVKLKEINLTFSELKEKDYDILMVNSDQTWNNYYKKYFLDYGFLKFAQYWRIPKFVYGASLGHDYWKYSKSFDSIAKKLLKKFKGISVRENSTVSLVIKHLGIKPSIVLDPTFLINKKIYLNLIKNFNKNFNFKKSYICVYQLDKNDIIKKFIKKASKRLKYKIYNVNKNKDNYIEHFIFCMNISKAVITDSFHGTIFSIIFNKSFISFINSQRGKGRFISLKQTFNLNHRIIFVNKSKKLNINLLKIPLNINKELLNSLKMKSINYLKKNLNIK